MGILNRSKKKKTLITRKKVEKRNRLHDIQTEYTAEDVNKISISARVTPDGALEFTTTGRWISLNFIMSKPHWAKDSGIKEKVRDLVRRAVSNLDIKIDSFFIVLRYNSRLDDHNTVMMPKYFTDSIKHNWATNDRGRILVDEKGQRIVEFEGIISEDNKSISKGTLLIPDESLPHNTYIMTYVPSTIIEENLWRILK